MNLLECSINKELYSGVYEGKYISYKIKNYLIYVSILYVFS